MFEVSRLAVKGALRVLIVALISAGCRGEATAPEVPRANVVLLGWELLHPSGALPSDSLYYGTFKNTGNAPAFHVRAGFGCVSADSVEEFEIVLAAGKSTTVKRYRCHSGCRQWRDIEGGFPSYVPCSAGNGVEGPPEVFNLTWDN